MIKVNNTYFSCYTGLEDIDTLAVHHRVNEQTPVIEISFIKTRFYFVRNCFGEDLYSDLYCRRTAVFVVAIYQPQLHSRGKRGQWNHFSHFGLLFTNHLLNLNEIL